MVDEKRLSYCFGDVSSYNNEESVSELYVYTEYPFNWGEMMRRAFALTLLVMIVAASAFGDEVCVQGLPYTNVKVIDFDDVNITFTRGKLDIKKQIVAVTRISLKGLKKFNRAEELLEDKRYTEAILVYSGLLEGNPKGWYGRLIKHRLSTAKQRLAKPPKDTSKKKPSSYKRRCPLCGGSGKMWCPHCRVGSHPSGKAKCSRCKGSGRITCPVCKGEWCKEKCYYCRGTGKVFWYEKFTKHGRKKYYKKCRYCGGTGYRWLCPRCAKQAFKLRGTVACPRCRGKGMSGKCPVCHGTKKVTCKHCGGAGEIDPSNPYKHKEKDKDPQVATDTVTSKYKHLLKSPYELAKVLQKPAHPREDRESWEKMTMLQRAEVRKKYSSKLKAWKKRPDLRGSRIAWILKLKDIVPLGGSEGYSVEMKSGRGIVVVARIPPDSRDSLVKLKKGCNVQVTGTIKSCEQRGKKPHERLFCIKLQDSVVSLTSKNHHAHSGKVHHVIYLVDRSKSMAMVLEKVHNRMMQLLSRLKDFQNFQVIYFRDDGAESFPYRGLRKVTAKNKRNVERLHGYRYWLPRGKSTPLVGLKRAFKTFRYAETRGGKTGKVLYFMSDGSFVANRVKCRYKNYLGVEAILKWLKDNNTDGKIRIHTYLYGSHRTAIKAMKRIAEENGGKFKQIK